MKSLPSILSLACVLLLGGCQRTIDVLTPNTRQPFTGFQVIKAYKKADVAGDSVFLEVGVLSSYSYFSKSKSRLEIIDGEKSLVVSVYCSRTPDRDFIRTPNGTFLKKIWTGPKITDDRLFYEDDAGFHEVKIQNWNLRLDAPYSPSKAGDPFRPFEPTKADT